MEQHGRVNAMEMLVLNLKPRVPAAIYSWLSADQQRRYRLLRDAYYDAVPDDLMFEAFTPFDMTSAFHGLLSEAEIGKGLAWLNERGIVDMRHGKVVSDDGAPSTAVVVIRINEWAMNYFDIHWRKKSPDYVVTQEKVDNAANINIVYTD